MYAFSEATRAEGTVASPGEIGGVDVARVREYVLAARLVAVRIAPYFATALLRKRERANPSVATLGVDRYWRLYWNPGYVMPVASRPDGVALLAVVWLHEVGHLVRDHPGRLEALGQPPERHVLFNVACDALINGDMAAMENPAADDRAIAAAAILGA
jgi:predicted metal-dependent peptidase